MQEYVRYPLVMKHSSHRKPTIRHMVAATNLPPEVTAKIQGHWTTTTPQSGPETPEMYPDVIVRDADTETYYVSRGYQPAGGADPAGARTIQAAPLPANYRPQEWPRAVGERVMGDPNAPTGDPNEYPKYLAAFDRMVYSRAEEDDLRLREVVSAPAVRHEKPALKREPRKPVAAHPTNAERIELLKMCRDLGIKHFAGWPVEKLRRLVEEATAPKAEDAA